ncbi:DUF2635 domain-containing protein [Pseudomonas japonica]|uniref:DUF2635 domain-containing protein n=1 Tax=Pseudomonas japonica TaxID=256466 RepID=UPI003A8BF89D
MTQQFIKPASKDLVVRRPDTFKRLPADGDTVTWSPFWQKRLDDGSIVKVESVPNESQNNQPGKKADPAVVDQSEVTK